MISEYKSKFNALFTDPDAKEIESDRQASLPLMSDTLKVLHHGVHLLSERETRIKKMTTRLASVGLATLVIAGACLFVALLLDPSTAISRIHVPEQVQKMYLEIVNTVLATNNTQGVAGTLYGSAINDLVTSGPIDFLDGTTARIIAGVMIMVGVFNGIIKQSLMLFFAGIFGGVMIYSMPTILTSVLVESPASVVESSFGNTDVVNALDTAPADKHLSGMTYEKLTEALGKINELPMGVRAYVLAQAAIKEEMLNVRELNDAAAFVRSGKATFEIPGSIAYAIESQAGGELQNPKAIALREDRVKPAALAKAAFHWVAGVSGVLFIISCFFGALALFIDRRIQRVKGLLGQMN
jgi:hypothetical protein